MIYTRICLLNVVTRSEPNLPVEKHCQLAQRFHRGIQMIWHTPNRPMTGRWVFTTEESQKKCYSLAVVF